MKFTLLSTSAIVLALALPASAATDCNEAGLNAGGVKMCPTGNAAPAHDFSRTPHEPPGDNDDDDDDTGDDDDDDGDDDGGCKDHKGNETSSYRS